MASWFLRMVRSYAKTECGKEYIEASKISGASNFRIVTRHLIPNVLPQFIVYFTTGIATAIMSVSSFAFLGVGLIAGTPEWGAMLDEARSSIYINPSLIIYPGICLIVCCAGFQSLGRRVCVTGLERRTKSVPLEVKKLTISLPSGEPVAENISFQIEKGEMLSIVWKFRCGKNNDLQSDYGVAWFRLPGYGPDYFSRD